MPFLKHIGKHNDRKVVVLFREVPQEDHMCLVIYPEVIQASWHDAIMRILESEVGQQAEQFADALHRNMLPDGRLILETLHQERIIKKIRCSDVLMTPLPNATIRLDELNKMLNDMQAGGEAAKKLQEADATRGLVDPTVKRQAEAAYKAQAQAPVQPLVAPADGALSDAAIAANNLAQAERMESEAKQWLAEAARLKKEAEKLFPAVSTKDATPVAPVETAVAAPKRRGRTPKAKVTNAI